MSPQRLPDEVLMMIFRFAAPSTVVLSFDTETTPPWGKTSLRLVCRLVNDFVLSINSLRWDVFYGFPKRMADPIYDWFVIINGELPRHFEGAVPGAPSHLYRDRRRIKKGITDWSDIPLHKLMNQYNKFIDTSPHANLELCLQRFPKLWFYVATYQTIKDTTKVPVNASQTSITFKYNKVTKRVYFHRTEIESSSEHHMNVIPGTTGPPQVVAKIYIVELKETVGLNQVWAELYPKERQSDEEGSQNDPPEVASNAGEFLPAARGLWLQICFDFNKIQTPLEAIGAESIENLDDVPASLDMVGTTLALLPKEYCQLSKEQRTEILRQDLVKEFPIKVFNKKNAYARSPDLVFWHDELPEASDLGRSLIEEVLATFYGENQFLIPLRHLTNFMIDSLQNPKTKNRISRLGAITVEICTDPYEECFEPKREDWGLSCWRQKNLRPLLEFTSADKIVVVLRGLGTSDGRDKDTVQTISDVAVVVKELTKRFGNKFDIVKRVESIGRHSEQSLRSYWKTPGDMAKDDVSGGNPTFEHLMQVQIQEWISKHYKGHKKQRLRCRILRIRKQRFRKLRQWLPKERMPPAQEPEGKYAPVRQK